MWVLAITWVPRLTTRFTKFRNQTDALPNATAGTPSPLPQLYEYRFFVEDGKNWTSALEFSFYGVSFRGNESVVEGLNINGVGSPTPNSGS